MPGAVEVSAFKLERVVVQELAAVVTLCLLPETMWAPVRARVAAVPLPSWLVPAPRRLAVTCASPVAAAP